MSKINRPRTAIFTVSQADGKTTDHTTVMHGSPAVLCQKVRGSLPKGIESNVYRLNATVTLQYRTPNGTLVTKVFVPFVAGVK